MDVAAAVGQFGGHNGLDGVAGEHFLSLLNSQSVVLIAVLGENNGIAYYFIYDKSKVTTLDKIFLSQIQVRADEYVIYADKCALSSKQLMDYRITFKKIPRDIAKL